MLPRIHKSSDIGAPVLTGTVASLNDLLTAALITGIGSAVPSPWTSPFVDGASNTKVFRAPVGTQHYLQVVDGGPGAGGAREARIRGYVTMSAFATGTELFPTAAQAATALCVRKSATLDTTPRAWRIYFDDRTVYLFIDCGDGLGAWDFYAFGEWQSWKANNIYNTLITGRPTENQTLHNLTYNGGVRAFPQTVTANKIYIPRDYPGAGTALEIGVLYDSSICNSVAEIVPGSNGQVYPYPIDGGILITPYKLGNLTQAYGRTRGLWIPGHNKPILQDDYFTTLENAQTRGFVAQNLLTNGQLFIENTDTWSLE